MVRGKVWRITPQNSSHGRVPLEFPVKEAADGLAVPTTGMDKIGVQ